MQCSVGLSSQMGLEPSVGQEVEERRKERVHVIQYPESEL